jgi:hypothetical protein
MQKRYSSVTELLEAGMDTATLLLFRAENSLALTQVSNETLDLLEEEARGEEYKAAQCKNFANALQLEKEIAADFVSAEFIAQHAEEYTVDFWHVRGVHTIAEQNKYISLHANDKSGTRSAMLH